MKSLSTFMNFTSIRYLAVTGDRRVETIDFDCPGKLTNESRINNVCKEHAEKTGKQFVSVIAHSVHLQKVKLPVDIINKYKDRSKEQ